MVRIVSLMTAAAVVISASPVAAHARLVSATPASGAVVSAPGAVSLTFSERFAAPFSSVEVKDGQGRAVTLRQEISQDGRTPERVLCAPADGGRL